MKPQDIEIEIQTLALLKDLNFVYDPTGNNKALDEVLCVSFSSKALDIDWLYSSTRKEPAIRASFRMDFEAIRRQINALKPYPGDCHIIDEADGSKFDAFVCLNPYQYLLFNYVDGSIKDVKVGGDWEAAKVLLKDFANKFKA